MNAVLLTCGILAVGWRGPKLIRTLHGLEGARVKTVADLDQGYLHPRCQFVCRKEREG